MISLNKLDLKKFGPFKSYEIDFVNSDDFCLLITGKNNEGKSNLILALKLVAAALRVVNQKRHEIHINSNQYWELLKQDTEDYLIQRMVYNYSEEIATISAELSNNFKIVVFIDPIEDKIYCDFDGVVTKDLTSIFGFIPPLGPIAEKESLIQNKSYLKASLNTSLAPRHFRNHIAQSLDEGDFELIKEIVRESWKGIKLIDFKIDYLNEARISCFFHEKGFDREVSWAGQGLQVWFQIITHLVRLREHSTLILDEPEINLHPEKQNDLIRIIKQYFPGKIIIATHSVELMNNVNISHIVHVKNSNRKPKIKVASDRNNLEIIRSHIGSNFNFISSQFDDVDMLLFTEDVDDFKYLMSLYERGRNSLKVFNIPLHGFSEYQKAIHYKNAYQILIGKEIPCSIVLDRDYYPIDYLEQIKAELEEKDINAHFTIGKEIENMFLIPNLLNKIFSDIDKSEIDTLLDSIYTENEKLDSQGSLIKLHGDFSPARLDTKTIVKKYVPEFDKKWFDLDFRHEVIGGKNALAKVRNFYRARSKKNLSDKILIDTLFDLKQKEVIELIDSIFTK